MRWAVFTPLLMLPIAANALRCAAWRAEIVMIPLDADPRSYRVTDITYHGTDTGSLTDAIDGDLRSRHRGDEPHPGIASRRAGTGSRRVGDGRGDCGERGAWCSRTGKLRTGRRPLRHLSR